MAVSAEVVLLPLPLCREGDTLNIPEEHRGAGALFHQLRRDQLILAGQGSSDSAVTVVGMFVGAAMCHNFGLAASGTALNPETKEVVAGAVPLNGKIACIICIVICFIIAFTNKREETK